MPMDSSKKHIVIGFFNPKKRNDGTVKKTVKLYNALISSVLNWINLYIKV